MTTGFTNARFAVTALVAATLLSACTEDAAPPSGFGVNVTVNARDIVPSERARIITARVIASSGPPSVLNIDEAIESGEVRFRFIPQAMSGELVLALEALDVAGVPVASGVSAPIALVPGAAAATTITLVAGGLPAGGDGGVIDGPVDNRKIPGELCTANAECNTNVCADGVCCNAPCDGVCESCALPGRLGFCDPIPANTDPQMECMVNIESPPPDDAGVSDGGVEDGGLELTVPDGGLMRNSDVCAGKCNGQRACAFPGTSTSCGTRWCNDVSEPASMVCNGAGSCEPSINQCVDYACSNGNCLTQCAKHEDCQTETRYCAPDNSCKPKKGNGIGCALSTECQSGHCSGGVCCNTACDEPLSCTQTPGSCRCPGVTCPAGVACQVYYRDADVDGFGDAEGTLGANTARAACAGSPPAGFVANNQDCDDGDANVKPGQTAFFDIPSRGKGTFDYNCDGTSTKADLDGLGSACRFQYGEECGSSASVVCKTAGEKAGNGCAISCGFFTPLNATLATIGIIRPPTRLCYPTERDGFIAAVGCGQPGAFRTCGTCPAVGLAATGTKDTMKKQACR